MKLAVFLDVDNTLTSGYIQRQYAKALGCEAEYLKLEGEFQTGPEPGKEKSERFGREIIVLFRDKGLDEQKAEQISKLVEMQSWTRELLELPGIEKYLVSSGPSYFIDRLAERYRIPRENVLRSKYHFEERTGLLKSCDAVDEHQKARYVAERASKYDITIGIGDSQQWDGPFVSHCTIPFLTVPTESLPHLPKLSAALPMIKQLASVGVDGTGSGHGDEPVEVEKWSLGKLAARMSLPSWGWVGGLTTTIFTAGLAMGRLL